MNTKETTSLMVKFNQSEFLNPEINDTILLDIFSKFAQVKDIRLIRDRFDPESYRNFVFVEYFTVEDAAKVISHAKKESIRILGERVYVTFSKSKRDEEGSEKGKGLYNVPESSLQYDPSKHKTLLEEEEKYLNPNEILKSEQLMPTSFVTEQAPKSKEQLEKEKADALLKKWERDQKLGNKTLLSEKVEKFDSTGLSLMNKKYDNIINMGKSKPIIEKSDYNPDDYVEIHV